MTRFIIFLLRLLLRDQPQVPEFSLGDRVTAIETVKAKRTGAWSAGSSVHAGLDYEVAGTFRQKDSGQIYVMRVGAQVPLPDAFPVANFKRTRGQV